jgi:hypothetical protein
VHAVLEAMTKAMQQPKTFQFVRIFSERALENVPLEGAARFLTAVAYRTGGPRRQQLVAVRTSPAASA